MAFEVVTQPTCYVGRCLARSCTVRATQVEVYASFRRHLINFPFIVLSDGKIGMWAGYTNYVYVFTLFQQFLKSFT